MVALDGLRLHAVIMTIHRNERLSVFGTSVFTEMTRLSMEVDAINLAQGFPDFDGPEVLMDVVHEAMLAGENQYAPCRGHAVLRAAIAKNRKLTQSVDLDPEKGVLVTNGATEALAAALLGILNQGDEVIIFEPFYDSYVPICALAGAVPRFYTLRFPEFSLDEERFVALINDRTRLVILNTPHNPTGKVFTRAELEVIERQCVKHDLILISDEVYEEIVFDDAEHVSPQVLEGLAPRTLVVGSAGKTLSVTGWKVGWAIGPPDLVAAAESAHQFLTFSTARPLQFGVARGLSLLEEGYREQLRSEYSARRDCMVAALREIGFNVTNPKGSYFVLAAFDGLFEGNDRDFAEYVAREHGVAVIPTSAFYESEIEEGQRLVRFSFCKELVTLEAAISRLRGLCP